jgi:hypothetical protein
MCVALLVTGCEEMHPRTGPPDDTADARSGSDGKRSGAQLLHLNRPITDDVDYAGGDKSDWYEVRLGGNPGVLATLIHWDSDASDVMLDIFDEFGAQISASPVRTRGSKQKRLLTQIEKPGIFYIRVTAPKSGDRSVYTMEAKWDGPEELPASTPTPTPTPVVAATAAVRHKREKEPSEAKERSTGDTVQGRIVSAYHDGTALTLHIDKGSSVGIRVGMTGTVLSGSGAPVEGGSFRVVQVLDATKSVGRSPLHSLGKNLRVVITLSR